MFTDELMFDIYREILIIVMQINLLIWHDIVNARLAFKVMMQKPSYWW